MKKTPKMIEIEDALGGEKIELFFDRLHAQEGLAPIKMVEAIAVRTGIEVSVRTIRNWIKRLGTPPRGEHDTNKQAHARELINQAGLDGLLSVLYEFGLSILDIVHFFHLLNKQTGNGNFSVSAGTIEAWIKTKTPCGLRTHDEAVGMPIRRKKIASARRDYFNDPRARSNLSEIQKSRRRQQRIEEGAEERFCPVLKMTIHSKKACQMTREQFGDDCLLEKCEVYLSTEKQKGGM